MTTADDDASIGRVKPPFLAVVLAAVSGGVAACAVPGPTPPPPTPLPPAVLLDPRLEPALADLAAHPERTAGVPFERLRVTKVRPGIEHLCLTLGREGEPPFAAAVDVGADPWRVFSVAYVDPARPDEVQVPWNAAGPDETANSAEVCAAVLAGTLESWPPTADPIQVSGYLAETGVADAIRAALFANPGAFGIGRDGLPSVSLTPVDAPGTDPTAPVPLDGCLGVAVYVGGPRAYVQVRVRGHGDGAWAVDRVRLVRQATATPEPADTTGC